MREQPGTVRSESRTYTDVTVDTPELRNYDAAQGYSKMAISDKVQAHKRPSEQPAPPADILKHTT